MPAVITAILVITLITFHNEDAGFRGWMAGKDAATTRLAASELTNASRIEIVFKLTPPYSIFYYRVILKPLLVATPPEYLRILGESRRKKGSSFFFFVSLQSAHIVKEALIPASVLENTLEWTRVVSPKGFHGLRRAFSPAQARRVPEGIPRLSFKIVTFILDSFYG